MRSWKQVAKHVVTTVSKARARRAWRTKIGRMLEGNPNLRKPLPPEVAREIGAYWRENFGLSIDKRWHQANANVNGVYDPKYIPEDVFYTRLVPALNHPTVRIAFGDKNLFDTWLPEDIPVPDTILRDIHGRYYDKYYSFLMQPEVERLLGEHRESTLVVKPSVKSGGGRSVKLLETDGATLKFEDGQNVELGVLERLYGRDFIIQRKLEQHQIMAAVHPGSVNTVRVMTLRHRGEIHVVSSVVRFGSDGSHVDNLSAGGMACGLRQDGSLARFAVTSGGEVVTEHPTSDVPFSTVQVPNIDVLYASAKRIHKRVFPCDLASFDFAHGKNGEWIFIEINLGDQEINFHQFNNGALLSGLTESVLHTVLGS